MNTEKKKIKLPFTDEELMMFAMIYRELLKKTKQENIFEGIELIPGAQNGDFIM